MQTAHETPTSAQPPAGSYPSADSQLILACLERICVSAEFARSERMVSFLRLVTTKTLDGQKSLLTERLVGREVFGKPADWDPALDTIVRSEARRLRTKLDRYYAVAGADEPVRISIPKGGYAPEFEVLRPVEVAAAPVLESRWSHVLQHRGFILLGVLLLTLIAGAAFLARSRKAGDSVLADSFTTVPFTYEIGKEYSPAISPDGKTVAYVWDNMDGQTDLYLRPLHGGTPQRMNDRSAIRLFPSWSPDGKQVAFLEMNGEEIYVVMHQLQGGHEQRVTQIAKQVGRWADDNSPLLGNPGPVWTADGQSLLVADHDTANDRGGLVRVDFTGHRTQLTTTRGEDHDLYPRVSPDGKTLAYVRYSSHGVGELYVQPMAGGAARQLTFDRKTIQGVAWQQDSRSLLFSSNRGGSFQLWNLDLQSGTLHAVTTNSSSAAEPSIAPAAGGLLYTESTENWNIWRMPLADSAHKAERLISSTGRNYDPRYSPDGRRIAFVSDRSGTMELWVADREGKNARQLTHINGTWLGGISWSPKGDQIAFDARPQDRSAIFLISAEGGEPRLMEKNLFEERMPSWSADATSLYFNSNRDGAIAIWRKSLQSGAVQRISEHGMFAAGVTLRGLLMSTRTGELWEAAADGTNPHRLPDTLWPSPVMSWFVENDSLYLTRANDRDYTFQSYRNGKVTMLGDSNGKLVPNAPDVAVSPDQQWLLYAQQDSSGSDLKLRLSDTAKLH